MNIFKVLSAGNSSLKEPALSAILMHYLTLNETHGMESYFVQQFLKPFIIKAPEKFKHIKVMKKDELLNFSKIDRFTVETTMEARFDVTHTLSDKKNRFIDGVIEIKEVNNESGVSKVKYVFAIENKILAASASDKQQLKDEVSAIVKHYEQAVIFGFVFLTNKFDDNKDLLNELNDFIKNEQLESQVSVIKYCWQCHDDEGVSITCMLKNILKVSA